jgi:hypothetical protein
MAGFCAESIVDGAYGLVQVWGYHAAARVRQNTTTKLLVGQAFAGGGNVYCMQAVIVTGTMANCYIKGFALESALYTTTTHPVFIQCL